MCGKLSYHEGGEHPRLELPAFFFLYFIQEYVTGHAAIARAHDVSHRACLVCCSNVPRFWSDYDPGVATGVLTQATTLPEARCPAIRSLPRDCKRQTTGPMLPNGECGWGLTPGLNTQICASGNNPGNTGATACVLQSAHVFACSSY